ncbi:MAG: hypothetical protein M1473_07190 [Firmicutes bacterium]|nr:hypothetical protein [Bacillota bacterium]
MSEQNQECFSQPRNYHVLDKSRNRVYGFSLSHSNQGMQEWDLRLQVNEISVSATTRNAILRTAEFYDQVEGAFEHLASSQSRSFTSPNQTNFAQARMSVSSFATTSSSCSTDPSYQATYNAFSPSFRSDLVTNLNREYDTLGGNHHANFQDIRFSDSSFYVSTSGVGINYQVEAVTTNRYVEFNYNWENLNNNVPDFETRPRLSNTDSIDNDGIDASLNERLTRIDGVSIRQLRDPLGVREGTNRISECARKALDVFFDSSKEAGNGGDNGGYVPGDGSGGGSGSGPGWPGGGSGGSGGIDLCRQHYYWKSGERAFTMLVPCA